MCLTYESVFQPRAFAETRVITIPKVEIAPEYERVHFIGHALWNPSLTKEQLLAQAGTIETNIEQNTGYAAFLVDIKIKQYPPLMTDIDFIIDVPTTKSFAPIAPAVILAIIAILAVILGIAYLFWTTYIEYVKLYPCDQCSGTPMYEGWLNYLAHLKVKHPAKYEAIQESKSKNWWEEIPSTIKWVVGGAIAVAVIGLAASLARGR